MLLVLTGVAALAEPVRAEVLHGFVDIWDVEITSDGVVGFDFSEQKSINVYQTGWGQVDLLVGLAHGLYSCSVQNTILSAYNGASVQKIQGVALEDLTEAPPPPYCCTYWGCEVDSTLVMRTADHYSVKFALRWVSVDEYCSIAQARIEYYIQADGSRDFGTMVPVEVKTWGRIKALYR